MSIRPRPCDPKSGLRTTGPSASSRSTMARACSYDSSAQVAGVAMPARESRKLVIDLSTQRSMARASFQTVTPSSLKAWRTPSRNVTASKVPPDIVRTTRASGTASPKPSICSPVLLRVTIEHWCKRTGTVSTPRAENAPMSSRACQSRRSTTRPTTSREPSRAERSSEGRIEQSQIDCTRMKAFAGFQRGDCDLGRAEQHRIDGVKVAFDLFENLRKWPAIVARGPARKLFCEFVRFARRSGHVELDASPKNDGVVRSTHSFDEIGIRRTERCRPHAVDDAIVRETQFVGLMHRDFKHPRNDLGAADKRLGRRKNDRQIFRLDAAMLCDRGNDLCRRRLATFDDERGAGGVVGIIQNFKQRLAPGQRPGRPRSQRKERLRTAVIGKAPSSILAGKTCDHGTGGPYYDRPWPARRLG